MDVEGLVYLAALAGRALQQANARIAEQEKRIAELEALVAKQQA
jgi:uncharacterized coiled-coil protein SlyX